jgi:putative pyoverdin transport system ATP-binding/permease protein
VKGQEASSVLNSLRNLPISILLRRGSQLLTFDMAVLVVVAGLTNAGLLAIFNAAAENASNEEANGRYLALFVVTILMYVYSQRYIMFKSIAQVEVLLDGIRVRLADRLRRTELQDLEQLERGEVFGVVSRATQTISQAASTLVVALQAVIMVTFSVGYLAILSPMAFVITVALSSTGIFIYLSRQQGLNSVLYSAQRSEDEFLRQVTHLVDGFKEVKLRESRSVGLFDHLRETSAKVQGLKSSSGREFAAQIVFAQLTFYVLLAGVVFLLPRISSEYSTVVLKLTTAILFIIGPLSTIVGSIAVFAAANVAAHSIIKMEDLLGDPGSPNALPSREGPFLVPFEQLEIVDASFSYPIKDTDESFQLGPMNLLVNAGEIVFIVGGNGSGKSTLLKNLTGLYYPQVGKVALDGVELTADSANWHRSHFAAVFSDYHLFERLYGLENVAQERVVELLKLMQISDKTGFVDGQFTTLDLSQGQRKRLGLLVALAEERPILVLDEWAADQDPSFRRFFYEELLPQLREEGRTIIAVTHDDRYFHCADRVLKMDYGSIIEYDGV